MSEANTAHIRPPLSPKRNLLSVESPLSALMLSVDKSELDLLFSEASSTGEAAEECFVSLLVCREQPQKKP